MYLQDSKCVSFWAAKKYRGHRAIPADILTQFDQEQGI